jgi:hypothetical protein
VLETERGRRGAAGWPACRPRWSLRIFLKHFRNNNHLFRDAVVKAISKIFNKREDREDGEGEEGKSG